MGCFRGCFGHLRRNLSTKKVQDQCLSPTPSNEQHECVKLLPEITESQKQDDEQIINPIPISIKVITSESEDKQEEKMDTNNEKNPFFDHSNLEKETHELASSNSDKEVVGNGNGKVEEKENEKDKNDDESDSNFSNQEMINEKDCGAVEEESCSSLFSLSIDSRRQVYGVEMGEKEVSSLMKTKNRSLGNDEEKENVALSKDPIIMEQTIEKSKPIETSLSTWLVESKMSGGSSPESENNYGDRQILGVISSAADVKKDFNLRINVKCSDYHQPEVGTGTVGQQSRQMRNRV